MVVQGTAKVVIGETEKLVRENESVYIVATEWHRLENPGKVPLEIIEVQSGSYLGEDDIVDHSELQKQIKTPLCLDESIHTVDDARKAIRIGSCRIINIKYGRVGGLLNSVRIHDLCKEAGVGNWIGGMIETGIGQVIKTALGTCDNFVYAADIETSDRFVVEDVITPDLAQTDGYLDANIEYHVDEKKLNKYTAEVSIFKA